MPFHLIFTETDPSKMVEFGGLAMSGLSLLGYRAISYFVLPFR